METWYTHEDMWYWLSDISGMPGVSLVAEAIKENFIGRRRTSWVVREYGILCEKINRCVEDYNMGEGGIQQKGMEE